MKRGYFIVFEGPDRSGKTTQTKLYADFLRKTGVPIAPNTPWRFPDRTTEIGKMINAYLQSAADLDDRTLHLLFSANRWEKEKLIRETLEKGETVILDRYAYSGIAYSAAKGLPFEWCKQSDEGLPQPDVVIYLDLPVDVAQKRGEYGNERFENIEMQTKVINVFKKFQMKNWKAIDANNTEDIVFKNVLSTINQSLNEIDNNNINKLNTLW